MCFSIAIVGKKLAREYDLLKFILFHGEYVGYKSSTICRTPNVS